MNQQEQKPSAARIRANAIRLGLLALLVYGGFIFLNWYRGH